MQQMPPEDAQNQTIFTSIPSMSGSQQPLKEEKPVPEKKQPLFYTQEDDLDPYVPPMDDLPPMDDQANQSTPFVLPFQHSGAMPTFVTMNAQGQGATGSPQPGATPTAQKRWGSFHVFKLLLIGSVVFVTILGASMFVFAQPAPSPHTTRVGSTPTARTAQASPVTPSKPKQRPPTNTHPPATPSPQAITPPSHQGQGTQGSGNGPSGTIPSAQQLNQIGWTQAGLTLGDALELLRTGSTFTDREMSYDYRNIGTPTNHSGTLTGSIFLLTSGGQIRFIQNDVRMINNVLYDKIQSQKIIQQAVNAQPSLVQLKSIQVQGQQRTIAWVHVAFELLQSKIDLNSGKRTEALESNPATGQPLLHHMAVILVRVAPQNQGANAPMGGTGWLVNTYALDTNTLPDLATDPFL
ncbi:hypothetical protein KDW_07350 [Dictyobacter vulcani]|uniref:Uncharacterized protein n=1 Tax=Dictyobacter vulcani TaxID=2607529 RepID=A0A5J4KFX0_9CHLR|nr:hypothetical protein [Dictyobacter vulcani]GER86573.1 hypothetical protein KDW_07350 [Dictyobacter vulcani]